MSPEVTGQPIKYHGTLQAPYQAAPLALSRDISLSDSARSIALWLWSHNENYRISQNRAAEQLARSRNTVRKAFTELQDARWLIAQPVRPRSGARPLGFIYHLTREGRFTDRQAERLSADVVPGCSESEQQPCAGSEHLRSPREEVQDTSSAQLTVSLQLPGDWQPTATHHGQAVAKGVDLDALADTFTTHFADSGESRPNWNAVFGDWINREAANPGVLANL
ncbi:hypothetical protein ACIGKQ_03940 [Gordonia sp. NPDC062954]|uniref:hypothetical protein n=1 Tax=Gordonia sp. NPDC062954 TaxID=3364003 RepID=UPI0037C5E4F6